jgi:hypothetical protein
MLSHTASRRQRAHASAIRGSSASSSAVSSSQAVLRHIDDTIAERGRAGTSMCASIQRATSIITARTRSSAMPSSIGMSVNSSLGPAKLAISADAITIRPPKRGTRTPKRAPAKLPCPLPVNNVVS